MFNVLVVDDDVNIREGIGLLAPWEEYGFRIAGLAADGREALEKYKKQTFELLIVDMQMPKMSGLELITRIRNMDPFIHVLVLSGYSEFEYAKKSISLKVDGYLLKPVCEEEFIQQLRRISTVLKTEKEERIFMESERLWRCNMLIQAIISGNTAEAASDIAEKASLIGLAWPSYQVLLLEYASHTDPQHNMNLRRGLKQVFNGNARGIVFGVGTYHGILLNSRIVKELALQALYAELAQINDKTGEPFYAAIGEPVDQIADIASSFETAVKLLNNRFIAGGNKILSPFSTPGPDAVPSSRKDNFDIDSAAGKLYFALEAGNMESVARLLSEWERRMAAAAYSENSIKTYFMQVISLTLNKLAGSGFIGQPAVKELLLKFADIYGQSDFKGLKALILRHLSEALEYVNDTGNEIVFKKVIDMVDRNYNEKLTLEMLADAYNYGSGYFGKLFKRYSGEHFNTYLDRVRINKAKELLQNGVKVYRVAALVGYPNVDYFYAKFKKYAGVSPMQYRRNNSGQNAY